MDQHRVCASTIKGLAMDAIQAANSGHPGMPLGAADMATVLWRSYLKHDPDHPDWPDRDRFVLSAGHGSMLLYSLLHLSGYDLSLDDLRAFRQWGSRTPGHPEVGETPGVETTTGPLGQGFAMGIGMAIAERLLRDTFGAELCDHYIYAICGDGDLMEGISHEAASLAGNLGLGHLVYLFDDNHITIDGDTSITCTDDVPRRFESYGWHVQSVDGHDPEALALAIANARAISDQPSIICCRTTIGKDCDIEGSNKTHGSPLGAENIAHTKARIGLDPAQSFQILDGAYAGFRGHDGPAAREAWQARLAQHPERERFERWLSGQIDDVAWPQFEVGTSLATRKASAACLKAIYTAAPWVVGGSADLAGSNGTGIGATALNRDSFANAGTLNFGIREHAMAALCNGMVLHGGVRPYCATFLVFHDYHRPSVRLSALMHQPVIYVYTHDSVFLGEDGPTHQPVASLLALRSLPNLTVFRPADATETMAGWQAALSHTTGPTALILSRQGLPVLEGSQVEGAKRGGYVLSEHEAAQITLLATGSEVSTALQAASLLADQGTPARVVSLPSLEIFGRQPTDYRATVLGELPRLSIEAGVTLGWAGLAQAHVGIDRYGASAPAEVLAEQFGLTPVQIAQAAHDLLRS